MYQNWTLQYVQGIGMILMNGYYGVYWDPYPMSNQWNPFIRWM